MNCPTCNRTFGSDRALRSHRSKVAECQPTLAQALWSKTEKSDDPEACWLWLGSKRRKGYGRMWWRGRTYIVSHVALEVDGRPLRPGEMACHHCDNPSCVNPTHLFRGTASDNMQDMNAKGRRNLSPEYRRSLGAGVAAAWAKAEPEKRRMWSDRIRQAQMAAITRCAAPLVQSDGLCFRVQGHTGSHRSELGMRKHRG